MDSEFQRALTIVLAVGLVIGGAGATALFVVFRRFAAKDAGSNTHVGIIAALLLGVLACCAVLFAWSYAGG